MQAPQSRTAARKPFSTESFPALQPITSQLPHALALLPESPHPSYPSSLAEGRGLAHDAGNLLGALGLYCELLAMPGVLRTEHQHYAEELQMLRGRSQRLIDQLLNPATTARAAHQKEAARSAERISLPDVIEDCRSVLNAVARRTVVVCYETRAALPVAVSRESLERILVNLTKNAAHAVRHTQQPEAIRLRVCCQREGEGNEHIILTVEDKGEGMSTAAVQLLMEAHTAKSASGHGIGFQIVRELVNTSGGQLHLTSTLGSGTTVSVAWSVAAHDELDAAHVFPNPLEERRQLMRLAKASRTFRLERATC